MSVILNVSQPNGFFQGLIVGSPEATVETEIADLASSDWTELFSIPASQSHKMRLLVVQSDAPVDIAVCLPGQEPDSATPIRLRPSENQRGVYTGILAGGTTSVHARLL